MGKGLRFHPHPEGWGLPAPPFRNPRVKYWERRALILPSCRPEKAVESKYVYRMVTTSILMGKIGELFASRNRRDLVLPLLIVTAGLLIFGWTIFSSISGIGEELIQVIAPGTMDLDLEEAGDYTIFYENVSFFENRLYSTGETFPSGLEINIVDLSSGERVDLQPPMGSSTYSIGGRSGRSIATFKVDHPGTYRMTTQYSPGSEGPEVVLAVGHEFMMKIISAILISFAAFFGSIVVAALVFVSSRSKKEKEEKKLWEEERMMRGFK